MQHRRKYACCDALARNILSMAEVVNLWVWLPFRSVFCLVSRFTSTRSPGQELSRLSGIHFPYRSDVRQSE